MRKDIKVLRIGIDIGGTNIKAGIVEDISMKILTKRVAPFPREGVSFVCKKIKELTDEMAEELGVSPQAFGSIGISVPGSVNTREGMVIDAHNLGFHDIPLREETGKLFPGIPAVVVNDADAAAWGEFKAGALKGFKNALLITIGTGMGGGLIIDGKLFSGGQNRGIEPGHMIIAVNGEPCTCGNLGCAESYCTATWLKKQGQLLAADKKGLLYKKTMGDEKKVNAKMVIDAAKEGDSEAKKVFDIFVENLSSAVASANAVLDPQIIGIGGGVSLAGGFLFEPLSKKVAEKCFFRTSCSVVPACLGNDGGMLGAALSE